MTMIRRLLEDVATGRLTIDQAASLLAADSNDRPSAPSPIDRPLSPTSLSRSNPPATFAPVEDFAKIDSQREERTGFPEAIWGPGKTPDQIAKIMAAMRDQGQACIMATRIEPTVYEAIAAQLPNVTYYETARICALQSPESFRRPYQVGTIALLSAGTADLPVADEAAVTAELLGFRVDRFWDVGVAGIHRLLAQRDRLQRADVAIVVAGMEGALPSVVAGLVDYPIVAVPTSIGYGAHFNGLAPLLTMLNSCAVGIGVVNIDNGFGAAILAAQILRAGARLAKRD